MVVSSHVKWLRMPVERSPTKLSTGNEGSATTSQGTIPVPARASRSTADMDDDKGAAQHVNIDATHTVRLPPFWKDNQNLWFAQVEAAFAIHRITGDESRFRYVILHVDQNVLPFVADLITNPPAQDKYLSLKERICSILGETSVTKIRKLLGPHELGEEKPSIFLQRLRNLAAGQVTDEVLKSIFIEQLPEGVRTILAISEVQDLSRLAAQADNIVEMAKPTSAVIHAASGRPDGPNSKILQEIAELKQQVEKLNIRGRQRWRSKSREYPEDRKRSRDRSGKRNDSEPEYCYYHNRFGSKAYKCTQPCAYTKPKTAEN